MIFRFYFVKQINGDGAENVVGDRQDRETGTGDRRTRIQRDETGNIVGDRQDREAGTEDRQTRIQKDEAGNVASVLSPSVDLAEAIDLFRAGVPDLGDDGGIIDVDDVASLDDVFGDSASGFSRSRVTTATVIQREKPHRMADLFGKIMGEAAAIKGIPIPAPPLVPVSDDMQGECFRTPSSSRRATQCPLFPPVQHLFTAAGGDPEGPGENPSRISPTWRGGPILRRGGSLAWSLPWQRFSVRAPDGALTKSRCPPTASRDRLSALRSTIVVGQHVEMGPSHTVQASSPTLYGVGGDHATGPGCGHGSGSRDSSGGLLANGWTQGDTSSGCSSFPVRCRQTWNIGKTPPQGRVASYVVVFTDALLTGPRDGAPPARCLGTAVGLAPERLILQGKGLLLQYTTAAQWVFVSNALDII
ncbi:unnamed protein product [Boreogadus saida]